jgi:hypothetical protein
MVTRGPSSWTAGHPNGKRFPSETEIPVADQAAKRSRLDQVVERVESLVVKHPMVAFFGAVSVGLLVGWVVKRR